MTLENFSPYFFLDTSRAFSLLRIRFSRIQLASHGRRLRHSIPVIVGGFTRLFPPPLVDPIRNNARDKNNNLEMIEDPVHGSSESYDGSMANYFLPSGSAIALRMAVSA